MATLTSVLADVQGLRNDAATSIADRFDSVEALANAKVDDLVTIKGVGKVLATRLIDAARTSDVKAVASASVAKIDAATTKAATKVADAAAKARKAGVDEDVVVKTTDAVADSLGFLRGAVVSLTSTVEGVASTAVAAFGREAGDGVEWTGEAATSPLEKTAGFVGASAGKVTSHAKGLSTTALKLVGGVQSRITNRG